MAKLLKRPRDSISLAKLIGDTATGQVEDAQPDDRKNPAAVELGRKGGEARAKALGAAKRKKIAKSAARNRWGRE